MCSVSLLDHGHGKVMTHNLRLVEASKVIGEWTRPSTAKDDNEANMDKRITRTTLFGLVEVPKEKKH